MIALFLGVALLTGCGTSTSDRAVSGAGIGAAVGSAGAAVTGGSIVGGALLGAGAGAAAGGLTKEKDIDLGDPIWK
ncbi:MAG: hypothetical protein WAS73_11115 [Defluviicoccus sp.]